MSGPVVTVLIDTYNHERFIKDAICSVLEQDYPSAKIEILVVDDGSTDRTPEIVRSFAPQVRLVEKSNGGQASAFNVGIPEARGEFIAFLDGDDWWAPHKLTRVVEILTAHPEIGVLGHGFDQIDFVTGEMIPTIPLESRHISFSSLDETAFFRRMMCFFGTSRVVIRTRCAQRALPIPESITIEADEFLSIMSIAHSSAFLISDSLTFYRLHSDNLYQFRAADARKLGRLHAAISALARELPARLTGASVSPEAIGILVGTLEGAAKKLKLQLEGGCPWDTFKIERAERRYFSSGGPLGYRLFSFIALGLTLLMPPRRFYRLRTWYGASRFRRWRSLLGEPVPTAKISAVAISRATSELSKVGGKR
jgi:glycosyltransferase involved in cell wall biosynthesis